MRSDMSPDLTIQKNAQRICIYIGESDRWRGKPLYAAILETLKTHGVAGATVVRGVAGFGAHSRIHTAAILRISEDLPLRIEVIDSPEKVATALDIITPMVREGLITVDEVQVIRYTHRYLNPLPADKPISEVMTYQVVTLSPQATVAQAWERMLEHLLKAMPVIDESQHVLGMLTDEDLIHRAGLHQHLSVAARLDEMSLEEQLAILQASQLKVADVMSKPAITAHIGESLGTVAARMAQHEIKRLPVLDEAGKLVGVVARIDVLRQVMGVETKSQKFQPPKGALMTVQQVMYPQIPAVPADADLAAIVSALVETGMRRLIVIDAHNHPIGLISDSDVVSRIQPRERRGVLAALRGGPAPISNASTQELMSAGVLTAGPETPLIEAARQMLSQQRKWLVVVDQQGQTLGLVDRQILLRAITSSLFTSS
jgi:CBS-domain-containing membrane protein/PII-like signaling protein